MRDIPASPRLVCVPSMRRRDWRSTAVWHACAEDWASSCDQMTGQYSPALDSSYGEQRAGNNWPTAEANASAAVVYVSLVSLLDASCDFRLRFAHGRKSGAQARGIACRDASARAHNAWLVRISAARRPAPITSSSPRRTRVARPSPPPDTSSGAAETSSSQEPCPASA